VEVRQSLSLALIALACVVAGCNLERIYNARIGHEWPKLGPYNTSVEVWDFVSRFSTRGS
jgi:hypothetical protein